MIVKVGDKKYDSEKEPIMLELSLEERELIHNMDQSASKYCSFPEGMSTEDLAKFMEVPIGDLVEEEQFNKELKDGEAEADKTDAGDTQGDMSEVRQDNAKG